MRETELGSAIDYWGGASPDGYAWWTGEVDMVAYQSLCLQLQMCKPSSMHALISFTWISTQLFPDYSKHKVYLRWLPLLEDFSVCGAISWGSAVLNDLYMSLYFVSMIQTSLFSEHNELLHVL